MMAKGQQPGIKIDISSSALKADDNFLMIDFFGVYNTG